MSGNSVELGKWKDTKSGKGGADSCGFHLGLLTGAYPS